MSLRMTGFLYLMSCSFFIEVILIIAWFENNINLKVDVRQLIIAWLSKSKLIHGAGLKSSTASFSKSIES